MIKIALCEDEIIALEDLKEKVTSYILHKNLEYSITLFLSGDALLACVDYYDIIFLDIKMNGTNGMETAKKLRQKKDESSLIFVTSLKEYVFDAFDVGAVNYLLKPVDERKLVNTMDKIINRIVKSGNEFLLLQVGHEIKKLKLEEIFYAEVLGHKVFIYTKNGIESFNKKIEILESELNENFFRCHRSYIINFKYVRSYSQGFAVLTTDEEIPVAKRRGQEFAKALLLYQRKEVR